MNRLKQLREGRDYTQGYMAQLLNISRSTYTKYESGSIQMGQDVLVRLADLFEVSIDYLLGRSNAPSDIQKSGPIGEMEFAVWSTSQDFSYDEWSDLNDQANLIKARRNRKYE